ncbi:sulfatase [Rubinisphaera sp.]|uniref:sulfatase n=1 Tax=Rubinisphaera sp. TaxID=2024857 RepID=UPI000C1105D3|nr:sulfatase [Rubinisphaera sp.]MBV08047.1 sulfatase [Rubinisphaera sp.]HCS51881.1 sulfatase [Planctomycetaceae bacterium]|tara:strand:+ start:1497 stop:3071 length:1575 start_codon:yes stop_codon:yes gene_type:complete
MKSILFCSLFSAFLAFTTSTEAKSPNFVFILVDDLGKQDLGIEGSEFYETPNIDSLAQKSMRFDRGYSACQVCSPSRAAIQTGKTPARLHITDYIAVGRNNQPEKWGRNTKLLPAEYKPELPLSETTIAEALKEQGYHTFFAGKWHLGGDGHTPSEQGYDINQGGYHFGTPPGGYHSPYNNPKLSNDEPGAELPIRLGKETAKFIEDNAKSDEPFFAMLSFYSVHGPIQCSQNRWEKFQAKAEKMGLTKRTEPRFILDRTQEVRQVQDHPVYAGMMAALDDAVGLVLEALKKNGLEEETVVIFTSDNGGVSSGDGYATSCLPYRGGKGRQWEGGTRQPFYICWPGVTNGEKTEVPAIGMDFYPTILDIAGIPLQPDQHVDGISLVPVMKGKSVEDRELFWHYPHYGNQGGEPSAMVVDGDWKLIHYFEDGRNELYNISDDVGEQTDISERYPDRVEELSVSLINWQKEVGADFPSRNQKYNEQAHARSLEILEEKGMPRREQEHANFLKPDFKPNGGWWDQRGR